MLEMAGARHHYHAPLTRTLYFGVPAFRGNRFDPSIIEGVDAALNGSSWSNL
ncbi:MAG: hypothetical protein CM1200mP18_18650 [Gammaproteobacteria bacterium]|nr:MAG: hypothetical protein CM1200mP18_18650 [Gammaproteobacteria bacterium]